jgi:hypothetical protein
MQRDFADFWNLLWEVGLALCAGFSLLNAFAPPQDLPWKPLDLNRPIGQATAAQVADFAVSFSAPDEEVEAVTAACIARASSAETGRPTADDVAGSSGQGPATAPPWLRQIIGDDEECLAAYRFKMEFEPAEGIDYKWVSQHSKELYALYSADLKDLDGKASGIITHLGSATVLVATASVFAVGMGTLHPLVALFLAVPLVFALIALAYAVKTRKPTDTAASPMPKAATAATISAVT